MKKIKWKIVIPIVIVLAILLTPIRLAYKDGGTVKYKSLVYEATKFHQLPFEKNRADYIEGWEIKILGRTIYYNTNE